MTKDRRRTVGQRAEDIAVAFLTARGYTILARNWRRPEGELDLVADHGGMCVFVEVRSRTGTAFGHPLESVNRRKQARVIRAARMYLQAQPTQASAFRFDVVGVTFPDDGNDPDCVHVENAFEVT